MALRMAECSLYNNYIYFTLFSICEFKTQIVAINKRFQFF